MRKFLVGLLCLLMVGCGGGPQVNPVNILDPVGDYEVTLRRVDGILQAIGSAWESRAVLDAQAWVKYSRRFQTLVYKARESVYLARVLIDNGHDPDLQGLLTSLKPLKESALELADELVAAGLLNESEVNTYKKRIALVENLLKALLGDSDFVPEEVAKEVDTEDCTVVGT